MTKKNKIILEIEMIPATNFYNNVRSAVTKKQWDELRTQCYESANYRCEICGDVGTNQGYKHNCEAHEVWEYDHIKNIQKLIRLIALCPKCHQIKHIGRTFAIGKQHQAIMHLMTVNNMNEKEVMIYIGQEFKEHSIRSQYIWTLDLTYLTDKYGTTKIDLDKASKAKGEKTYYYKKTKKDTRGVKKTPKKK